MRIKKLSFNGSSHNDETLENSTSLIEEKRENLFYQTKIFLPLLIHFECPHPNLVHF